MNLKSFVKTTLTNILSTPNKQSNPAPQNQTQTQSAVGIIFKYPENRQAITTSSTLSQLDAKLQYFLDLEILLLQRQNSIQLFANDVCLPGGKRQPNQTLEDTVFRQIKQEIGLKLTKKDLIGRINKKFIILKRNNLCLASYAFVFLIQGPTKLSLNLDQLSDHKWIPLRYFLSSKIYKEQPEYNLFAPKYLNIKKLEQNISSMWFASVEVGLKHTMYGITLAQLGHLANLMFIKLLKVYSVHFNKTATRHDGTCKDEQQNFYLLKRKLEMYLYSLIKFKNRFYQPFRIISKQNLHLSESQKKEIESLLRQNFKFYYPLSPKI